MLSLAKFVVGYSQRVVPTAVTHEVSIAKAVLMTTVALSMYVGGQLCSPSHHLLAASGGSLHQRMRDVEWQRKRDDHRALWHAFLPVLDMWRQWCVLQLPLRTFDAVLRTYRRLLVALLHLGRRPHLVPARGTSGADRKVSGLWAFCLISSSVNTFRTTAAAFIFLIVFLSSRTLTMLLFSWLLQDLTNTELYTNTSLWHADM